ncbi:hypothetical protein BU25DRAFT_133685 [Macroventuria anomochaeta]|uniref:Uncharacterized protein n=1 Tax=Macroventuria anomochaeta TaxID=301207 RepID=A0ACB6RUD9_9PLEO|nr:uncharacterized protein BU25DRAFT_133685 [Macroventuria anomochaeta]KAF2624764.1 hypothetical protein BU25DRAFT_133685 [Macroventuria anomochaeta]
MFLDLPVELRLRIAEYALEQRPGTGIPHIGRHLENYKGGYRPSENMSLLLVCHQFNRDFTQLAYNKTRFMLWTYGHGTGLQGLPLYKLRSIRKLVYRPDTSEMQSWGSYLYNLEQLHVDELVFLWHYQWTRPSIKIVISFLRRLLHINTIKFVLYAKREGKNRSDYCSLVGAIMKEDHFQRYDAPGAPNVEATWWDWHLDTQENIITFRAQDPRPVLPEEDYMLLMKPEVDALMAEAERAAGLWPVGDL